MPIQKLIPLVLSAWLFAGCTSTKITNLTARQIPRNANGIYLFEVALTSNQQTLRQETLKPHVLVDFNSYPMEPALMLKNRWEALIPIPADKKVLNYRYKFDYNYNRFGPGAQSSKLSPQYQLEITEK